MINAIDLLRALDELGNVKIFKWQWIKKKSFGFYQAVFFVVDKNEKSGSITVSFREAPPATNVYLTERIQEFTKLDFKKDIDSSWDVAFSLNYGKKAQIIFNKIKRYFGAKDKTLGLFTTSKGITFEPGTTRSVMHTVIDVCVEFIKLEDPDVISWSATSKRRTTVYNRIVKLALKELSASKKYTAVAVDPDDFLIKVSILKSNRD